MSICGYFVILTAIAKIANVLSLNYYHLQDNVILNKRKQLKTKKHINK